MASLLSHILSSTSLFSYGLYHLVLTTKSHFRSPSPPPSKPYHPLPISPPSRLKHLPLHLILVFLFLSILHHSILSSLSDPLVPVHRIYSLQSVASLLLFFLISIYLLLSHSSIVSPIPSDLIFALSSVAFALQSSVSLSSSSFQSSVSLSSSSFQSSHLQAKCDSVSSKIFSASAAFCIALAFNLRLFIADVALAGSLCLQGLWVLQTGLSLYADMFIPEGCHRLLDVVTGVDGSTKCEREESQLRAIAILDLVFVFHVMFVAVVVIVVYAVMARTSGVRRVGSYEALSTGGGVDLNHVQMKAMTNTQV